MKRTMIAVLVAGLTWASACGAQGLDKWRFGMTLEQIKATPGCKAYKPVPSTGGLECSDYVFAGQSGTISFVLRSGKLAKIQVWAYEGKALTDMAKRWHAVLAHLAKTWGPLESPQLANLDTLTPTQLEAELKKLNGRGKLQFKPKKNPKTAFVFGSAIVDPRGTFVMVYFQPPR